MTVQNLSLPRKCEQSTRDTRSVRQRGFMLQNNVQHHVSQITCHKVVLKVLHYVTNN